MQCDRAQAAVFGHLGQLHADNIFVVPAGAELYREWNLDGCAHRFEDFADRGQIAQQAGAAIALDHLLRRAAEVKVDQVKAEIFDHAGRVRHHSGIAAKKLG